MGALFVLKLPDDDFVSLELVHDPSLGLVEVGTGLSHLVVQVERLDATLDSLSAPGILVEAPGFPGGPEGPTTSWITDPDGCRIELTQWPKGHAAGMSAADF